MYVTNTRGYSSGARQVANTVGYVVTDTIGNDDSTGSATSDLDYLILSRMGYYTDVSGNTASVLDYLPFGDAEGYYSDVVQDTTGVLDYLIDNVPFDIIIEQERGWGFNWELITTVWETIDNNWNNG